MEKRNANIIFSKNGNGFLSNKITLPVPWVKELGFTESDRKAVIEFDDDKIIIKKDELTMNKNEIIKKLDEELEKILKENPTMHISSARKLAIANLGLTTVSPYTKKGYVQPQNCILWGSKAGYDAEFLVKEV